MILSCFYLSFDFYCHCNALHSCGDTNKQSQSFRAIPRDWDYYHMSRSSIMFFTAVLLICLRK